VRCPTSTDSRSRAWATSGARGISTGSQSSTRLGERACGWERGGPQIRRKICARSTRTPCLSRRSTRARDLMDSRKSALRTVICARYCNVSTFIVCTCYLTTCPALSSPRVLPQMRTLFLLFTHLCAFVCAHVLFGTLHSTLACARLIVTPTHSPPFTPIWAHPHTRVHLATHPLARTILAATGSHYWQHTFTCTTQGITSTTSRGHHPPRGGCVRGRAHTVSTSQSPRCSSTSHDLCTNWCCAVA
jgi:hypothetical protein